MFLRIGVEVVDDKLNRVIDAKGEATSPLRFHQEEHIVVGTIEIADVVECLQLRIVDLEENAVGLAEEESRSTCGKSSYNKEELTIIARGWHRENAGTSKSMGSGRFHELGF